MFTNGGPLSPPPPPPPPPYYNLKKNLLSDFHATLYETPFLRPIITVAPDLQLKTKNLSIYLNESFTSMFARMPFQVTR